LRIQRARPYAPPQVVTEKLTAHKDSITSLSVHCRPDVIQLHQLLPSIRGLLVIVGLYGVVSYLVTRRRNQLGIRIALGSTRARIVSLVMREAGRMLLVGTFVGALISLLATRGASSILFGLKSWDPATIAFAVVSLAAVAALASFLPAFRAALLDPVQALRNE
jgi:ABC-type antimicrobial peptide transport system permease subunit